LPQREPPRYVVKIRGRQSTSLEWGNPLGKSLGRLIDMETELLRSNLSRPRYVITVGSETILKNTMGSGIVAMLVVSIGVARLFENNRGLAIGIATSCATAG
jgi:hypothetical protein